MFGKNLPHGGARRGLCEKCGAEVQNCYPGSVCAQFDGDRASGAGD